MARPIGIVSNKAKDKAYLYSFDPIMKKRLSISESADGLRFTQLEHSVHFITLLGFRERFVDCSDFRFIAGADRYLVTYKRHVRRKAVTLVIAQSKDLIFWTSLVELDEPTETAAIVPPLKGLENISFYFGEHNIYFAYISNLQILNVNETPVLKPRDDHFDSGPLRPAMIAKHEDGLYLTYYSVKKYRGTVLYSIGIATLDKRHKDRVLWRSDTPLWQQPHDWQAGKLTPLGGVKIHHRELYYWLTSRGKVFATSCGPAATIAEVEREERPLSLQRLFRNPIIKPRKQNRWESKATFNPAAIHEGGRVHMVYRAIGEDDVSVLGYASSDDGINFDERHDKPIYVPRETFEGVAVASTDAPNPYASGGSVGGCEDPRLMRIGDRIYMTYVAYDGWSHPRTALTWISIEDFLQHHWSWSRPVLITRPDMGNKNVVIFPEPIANRYAILHREWPDIVIDYVSDLEFDGRTRWLGRKAIIPPRTGFWDSKKVGAGAPPIKTKDGWLLVYQSVGHQDPSKYKVGAMLLDLNDPSKVIARSRKPVLEPDMHYENEGYKFGVVYPCGAVVKNDDLFVYYGGADMVVCAAKTNLADFLERLKLNQEPHLAAVHA